MVNLTIRVKNLRPEITGGESTLKTRKLAVDAYNRAINDVLDLIEEQEFIYSFKTA